MFEWYVLNYNFNKRKAEMFNVFNNCYVAKQTEYEVRKYLRAPSKYTCTNFNGFTLYGFDAFVARLDIIIKCEEWGRTEYEIIVGDMWSKEKDFEKWDCYMQCRPNMELIAHEVIRQYKELKKHLTTAE